MLEQKVKIIKIEIFRKQIEFSNSVPIARC